MRELFQKRSQVLPGGDCNYALHNQGLLADVSYVFDRITAGESNSTLSDKQMSQREDFVPQVDLVPTDTRVARGLRSIDYFFTCLTTVFLGPAWHFIYCLLRTYSQSTKLRSPPPLKSCAKNSSESSGGQGSKQKIVGPFYGILFGT